MTNSLHRIWQSTSFTRQTIKTWTDLILIREKRLIHTILTCHLRPHLLPISPDTGEDVESSESYVRRNFSNRFLSEMRDQDTKTKVNLK